jgi:IS605 OrfB family transposase
MTAKKHALLNTIMTEYARVVNIFIAMFWNNALTRQDLVKEITNLPESWLSARMRQCAAREALGMVMGAKEKATMQEEAPVIPVHTGKKMMLSAQIAQVTNGHNSFDLWVELASIGNGIRMKIPIKRHRHFNWFGSWQMATSILVHRDYIQFSFEKEIGEKKAAGGLVGIDVGINHLLATSQGELIGSEVKSLLDTIKRKVQNSKGYRRAKKTLSYYLHKVVKNYVTSHDLRLIVVEKLQGLKQGKHPNRGKGFRKTLSNWNYRELLKIIQMRCEENRVSFRSVNPYKTSQTCPNSACSHVERGNRVAEKFQCLRCGYSNHADIVGALNILTRFTSGQYGAAFQT